MVNEERASLHSASNCSCRELKLVEAEKTIANKDVIIKMLREQVKRLEESYKQNVNQTEEFRYKYCLAAETIKHLRNCKNRDKHEEPKEATCGPMCDSSNFLMCFPEASQCSDNFIKSHYKMLQLLVNEIIQKRNCYMENKAKGPVIPSGDHEAGNDQSACTESCNNKKTYPTSSSNASDDAEDENVDTSTCNLNSINDAGHQEAKEDKPKKRKTNTDDFEVNLKCTDSCRNKDNQLTLDPNKQRKLKSSFNNYMEEKFKELQQQINFLKSVNIKLYNQMKEVNSALRCPGCDSKTTQIEEKKISDEEVSNESIRNSPEQKISSENKTNSIELEITNESKTGSSEREFYGGSKRSSAEKRRISFPQESTKLFSIVSSSTQKLETVASKVANEEKMSEISATLQSEATDIKPPNHSRQSLVHAVDSIIYNKTHMSSTSGDDDSVTSSGVRFPKLLDKLSTVSFNLHKTECVDSYSDPPSVQISEQIESEVVNHVLDDHSHVKSEENYTLSSGLQEIKEVIGKLVKKQETTFFELKEMKEKVDTTYKSTERCNEEILKLKKKVEEQKDTFLGDLQENKTVTEDLRKISNKLTGEVKEVKTKVNILYNIVEGMKNNVSRQPQSEDSSHNSVEENEEVNKPDLDCSCPEFCEKHNETDEEINVKMYEDNFSSREFSHSLHSMLEQPGIIKHIEENNNVQGKRNAILSKQSENHSPHSDKATVKEIQQQRIKQEKVECKPCSQLIKQKQWKGEELDSKQVSENENLQLSEEPESLLTELNQQKAEKDQRLKCLDELINYYKKLNDKMLCLCPVGSLDCPDYAQKKEDCSCPSTSANGSFPDCSCHSKESDDIQIEDIYSCVLKYKKDSTKLTPKRINSNTGFHSVIPVTEDNMKKKFSIEEIYEAVRCSCRQSNSQQGESSTSVSTSSFSNHPLHCDLICDKNNKLDLESYVSYLQEQLQVISSIENQIENLRDDVKK